MPKLLLLLLVLMPSARAEHPPQDQLSSFEVVGEAEFNYMFWRLYDIALYAPSRHFATEPPFAIRIRYSRQFSGSSIADYSSKLIRRQGIEDEMRLAGWHAQMDRIFPDVEPGTELTGLYTEDRQSVFYLGSREIGRIKDPLFGAYFFGIWLGEQTSVPAIREQLVGASDGR